LRLDANAVVVGQYRVGRLAIGHFAGEAKMLGYVSDEVGKAGFVSHRLAERQIAIARIIDAIADVGVQGFRTQVIIDSRSSRRSSAIHVRWRC